MAYVALLAICAASNVALCYLLLRFVGARDERHRAEVQTLVNATLNAAGAPYYHVPAPAPDTPALPVEYSEDGLDAFSVPTK